MEDNAGETLACCAVSNFKTKPKSNGHDCCTLQPKGKNECPKCSQKAKGVLGKTLKYLLRDDAKIELSSYDGFSYCKTPSCKVIYFKKDVILTQKDIKVEVGLKDGANPANMCYCFGWTKEKIIKDIEVNGKSLALQDIKRKMNTIGCLCEIKNPSGNCCMGDISKVVKEGEIK